MPTEALPIELLAQIDSACDRFEQAWVAAGPHGVGPRCEQAAEGLPEPARHRGLLELFAIERQYRADRGESEADWFAGRPELAALAAASRDDLATLPAPSGMASGSFSGGLRLRCPQCHGGVDLSADAPLEDITCTSCGSTFGLLGGGDRPLAEPVRVGRFLLRERLGVGGFGAVWRARDPELDRDVALKLPRRGGLTPREAEMFFREARAAAQLAHPGIVGVYEVGRDLEGAGSIYIVSELVDGEPLSDRLKHWRPTPRQAAAIVADLADALEYAHLRGVIHRDLKPSNVMLDAASAASDASLAEAGVGRPRLMDFGLAKREAGEATMTVEGQVLGTPAYMSPEQASGQVRWVDKRTDIYALGVVLFRLLTGELPFRGTATSQIQQRLTDDPPSPRRLDDSVPQDLATVCLKCLERDPGRRYDSAADLRDEMRRYLRGEPVHARPLSPWGRAGRWARRRPASATALGLTALLAVAGPVAAWVMWRQNQEIVRRIGSERFQNQQLNAEIDRLKRPGYNATRAPGDRGAGAGGDRMAGWRRQWASDLVTARGEGLLEAIQAESDPLRAARSRVGLAKLLAAADRPDEAITQLRAAEPTLRTASAVPDATVETRALYAEASEWLAKLLAAAGEPEQAAQALEQAYAEWDALAEQEGADLRTAVRRRALLAERGRIGVAGERPRVGVAALSDLERLVDPVDLTVERLYEQATAIVGDSP
ncbi:protein kinase [Botrimarina sp.]|uniref:protein kinase domain-containing protein n=1 Tax=Botrimarina sp. TaxID=2795802 RepID=UPI0032EAA539